MARARMLAPSISTDMRLKRLSCMGARFLYLSMIPHADNAGRLMGNSALVRALVMPNEPEISDDDVSGWLSEMDALGLICRYEVDETFYVQFSQRGWAKHQELGKWKGKSFLPAPPAQSAVTRRDAPESGPEVEVDFEVDLEVEPKGKEVNAREKTGGTAPRESLPSGSRSAVLPETERVRPEVARALVSQLEAQMAPRPVQPSVIDFAARQAELKRQAEQLIAEETQRAESTRSET